MALPAGVDTDLELVGTPRHPDTLLSARVHGIVCFIGMLSNVWTVKDFYPIDYIPRGVPLTAYGGDANDLPPRVLQGFLDAVAAGDASVPIDYVYRLDDIVQAHTTLAAGTASGKLVVTTYAPGIAAAEHATDVASRRPTGAQRRRNGGTCKFGGKRRRNCRTPLARYRRPGAVPRRRGSGQRSRTRSTPKL